MANTKDPNMADDEIMLRTTNQPNFDPYRDDDPTGTSSIRPEKPSGMPESASSR